MGTQEKKFTFIFGAVIAYILLFLYAAPVGYLIDKVIACGRDLNCSNYSLQDSIIYVITTTSGLVSALVIAKLSIIDPNDPEEKQLLTRVSGLSQATNYESIVYGVTIIYLIIWLIVGLSSLIVGVIFYPQVSKTLKDLGTTWLGLAIAAGYAFLGIKPRGE
jgi:hypothetical protein